MKKKIIATLILVLAIVGIFYIMDRMKYTSFKEVILNTVNKDDVITIDIERHSDNAKISIEDKGVVDKLLKEFSSMELKKTNDSMPKIGDYAVRIFINGTGTRGMQFIKGSNYIWIHNDKKAEVYNIINETDPLKIIEGENFDWKYPRQ
ncbi:hypothetical protein E1B06_22060 [Brevibacillus laterosporus]|uniref:hypothetical protein n=1 Tax=Brevibacillus laterosporus TaxID=1465 RepID=UPI00240590D2|nr:hypothetical protein [Brevibacillus laterosporus]MDF9414310.1 hypothetical protein [Brevibacillus laterosporus]